MNICLFNINSILFAISISCFSSRRVHYVFGKKKRTGSAEDMITKYAKTLPRIKKVQFCYLKSKELEEMLDKDISSVLILQPVNYYAEDG